MIPEQTRQLVLEQQEYVTAMRREFHRHPELSSREYDTGRVIVRELESMGIPVERPEGTGVIGVIRGGRPGPVRLLRADMDALPVAEDPRNQVRDKVCVSAVPGVSHACGHDAHMAMLLGAARLLSRLRDDLCGMVLCCFEEAEETTLGAGSMLDALRKYPVESCFALHVYAGLDAGRIDLSPGPRMSGTVRIDLDILGRSGHGSRPDQALNPIIPAAHIVTQLGSAFQNCFGPEEGVTLGLCVLRAGEQYNVIPDRAHIEGSARFFLPESGPKAMDIVRRTAENTAEGFGCSVRFSEENRISLQPVVNDPAITGGIRSDLSSLCGGNVLGSCPPWYASESFSRYLSRYPGALGLLGIRNPQYGSGAPHHSAQFDVDESVLTLGVCALMAYALS